MLFVTHEQIVVCIIPFGFTVIARCHPSFSSVTFFPSDNFSQRWFLMLFRSEPGEKRLKYAVHENRDYSHGFSNVQYMGEYTLNTCLYRYGIEVGKGYVVCFMCPLKSIHFIIFFFEGRLALHISLLKGVNEINNWLSNE